MVPRSHDQGDADDERTGRAGRLSDLRARLPRRLVVRQRQLGQDRRKQAHSVCAQQARPRRSGRSCGLGKGLCRARQGMYRDGRDGLPSSRQIDRETQGAQRSRDRKIPPQRRAKDRSRDGRRRAQHRQVDAHQQPLRRKKDGHRQQGGRDPRQAVGDAVVGDRTFGHAGHSAAVV